MICYGIRFLSNEPSTWLKYSKFLIYRVAVKTEFTTRQLILYLPPTGKFEIYNIYVKIDKIYLFY